MILNSFGSLSFTVARSGIGSAAAFSRSSVYLSTFMLGPWTTTPGVVVHSDSGTFQVLAAALMKIARVAAPTRRIGNQFVGVAVLPPADCPACDCGLNAASGPPTPVQYFAPR